MILHPLAFLGRWVFPVGVAVVLGSIASSLGGCGSAASSPDQLGGAGSGGAAGHGGSSNGPAVAFTSHEPLELRRGDTAMLSVQTTPPGAYVVRFALLPGPAQTPPGDAALSATDQPTDPLGVATVTVTAPSAPTTFFVRASTENGASDQRLVTVEKTGFADLLVQSAYAGDRPVDVWLATATPNQTCATLPGGPLDDGLTWTASEPEGESVNLRSVLADVQLAVVLRADHYAWGCATIEAAVEGMANQILVPVTNVPIQLTASELDVVLDLTDFEQAFSTALTAVPTALIESLATDVDDDVDRLLDVMQAESGSGEVAFDAVRTAERWDVALRTALGPSAATAIRAPLERWLEQGLEAEVGPLSGELVASDSDPAQATLTLTDVSGRSPDELGFGLESQVSWETAESDRVAFVTVLELSTSAFVVGSALSPALEEVTTAGTLAEALATLVPCDTVADTLIERGQVATESFSGCDHQCTLDLCVAALDTIVRTLGARSAAAPATIDVAAAGDGRVGADAELVGLDGSWVGALTVDSERTELGGNVTSP